MILPEHGGESVFQQDYLRGMQYNVYAKALFAPFGNQNHTLHTCGGCGRTTKERYLEILEFTHFVTFFSFNKIGENHKEKILVKKVTVVVALDLDTGNTKNPDNESE